MLTPIFEALERILFRGWTGRWPSVVSRARQAQACRMSVEEAYLSGYEAAYFEAVSDLITHGVVCGPMIPKVVSFANCAADEVH